VVCAAAGYTRSSGTLVAQTATWRRACAATFTTAATTSNTMVCLLPASSGPTWAPVRLPYLLATPPVLLHHLHFNLPRCLQQDWDMPPLPPRMWDWFLGLCWTCQASHAGSTNTAPHTYPAAHYTSHTPHTTCTHSGTPAPHTEQRTRIPEGIFSSDVDVDELTGDAIQALRTYTYAPSPFHRCRATYLPLPHTTCYLDAHTRTPCRAPHPTPPPPPPPLPIHYLSAHPTTTPSGKNGHYAWHVHFRRQAWARSVYRYRTRQNPSCWLGSCASRWTGKIPRSDNGLDMNVTRTRRPPTLACQWRTAR